MTPKGTLNNILTWQIQSMVQTINDFCMAVMLNGRNNIFNISFLIKLYCHTTPLLVPVCGLQHQQDHFMQQQRDRLQTAKDKARA